MHRVSSWWLLNAIVGAATAAPAGPLLYPHRSTSIQPSAAWGLNWSPCCWGSPALLMVISATARRKWSYWSWRVCRTLGDRYWMLRPIRRSPLWLGREECSVQPWWNEASPDRSEHSTASVSSTASTSGRCRGRSSRRYRDGAPCDPPGGCPGASSCNRSPPWPVRAPARRRPAGPSRSPSR